MQITTFGVITEEATVSTGAPATKVYIRTISQWIHPSGQRSSTGKQMVQGIITKRQDHLPSTPELLPSQAPRRRTSTAIRGPRARPTISERTNTTTNSSLHTLEVPCL